MSSSFDFADLATRTVDDVRSRRLTYLSQAKFSVLVAECQAARTRASSARFIEAGCALGGSAVVIANLRPPGSEMLVLDTFEGMPPPTERDSVDVHARYQTIASGQSIGIRGDTYYGYRTDLEQHVRLTMGALVSSTMLVGVELVRGLVQDTLIGGVPIAFAHVDVDWYDPVSICAQRIFPDLEVGGSIVFDDYSDYQSCRRAVDEYFADKHHLVQMDKTAGSCLVRRVRQA